MTEMADRTNYQKYEFTTLKEGGAAEDPDQKINERPRLESNAGAEKGDAPIISLENYKPEAIERELDGSLRLPA